MVSDLYKRMVRAVARHMAGRHYRLYIFGSRATGRGTPRSDYDLGLLADGHIDLGLLGRIRGDLEDLPILQTIDLVDLSVASLPFVQAVLQEGQLLDER